MIMVPTPYPSNEPWRIPPPYHAAATPSWRNMFRVADKEWRGENDRMGETVAPSSLRHTHTHTHTHTLSLSLSLSNFYEARSTLMFFCVLLSKEKLEQIKHHIWRKDQRNKYQSAYKPNPLSTLPAGRGESWGPWGESGAFHLSLRCTQVLSPFPQSISLPLHSLLFCTAVSFYLLNIPWHTMIPQLVPINSHCNFKLV